LCIRTKMSRIFDLRQHFFLFSTIFWYGSGSMSGRPKNMVIRIRTTAFRLSFAKSYQSVKISIKITNV